MRNSNNTVYQLKTTLLKALLLTLLVMFSGQTAPIETYDIPINSDFHGECPCKMWALGMERVFSNKAIKYGENLKIYQLRD